MPRRAERRAGGRRGGRPRSLSAHDVEWAIGEVWYRARLAVARDLGVDRRTLDRRLAERRAEDRIILIERRDRTELVFRCDQCGRRIAAPVCFCGHIINALLAAERAQRVLPDEVNRPMLGP